MPSSSRIDGVQITRLTGRRRVAPPQTSTPTTPASPESRERSETGPRDGASGEKIRPPFRRAFQRHQHLHPHGRATTAPPLGVFTPASASASASPPAHHAATHPLPSSLRPSKRERPALRGGGSARENKQGVPPPHGPRRGIGGESGEGTGRGKRRMPGRRCRGRLPAGTAR